MPTVSELALRARGGDLDAFTELVRRFQDMALAFAHARTRDRQTALDVSQEAFLTAFTQLQELRDPAAFAGWFRRILVKHIDRAVRNRKHDLPLETLTGELAGNATPLSDLEQAELRARVLGEIRALPEAQRTTLMLVYAGEHSLGEVSEFLQVPLGTVKRRLHDARARLKQRMFDMAQETLDELRPSRSSHFVERVRDLLQAVAAGNRNQTQALVAGEPELANASGPHPIWGGEPKSLQVAAELGQVELALLLLDHGADPDARPDAYNWSPLHLVLGKLRQSRAHREVAELLMARGATIDVWAAAGLGDVECLRALIARDPGSVHARGPNDATALHFAASVAVVRELLAAGADVEARDCHGNIPERFVAGFAAPDADRRDAARFLLELRGQHPDLFLACALGDAERVRELVLSNREQLAAQTAAYDGVARLSRGATALQVAVLNHQMDVARLLLGLGAPVDGRSLDGQTALHLAAGQGHAALARLLIEHGADRGAVDGQHGGTPLDWAEFHANKLSGPAGCKEVAALLRELSSGSAGA